jgi:hypothetical protein
MAARRAPRWPTPQIHGNGARTEFGLHGHIVGL